MAQKKAAPLDLRTYLAKAPGGTTKEYRKKHVIFSQGSPADAVFYIEKGKVKLTVLSTRGKEAVVAILGSGDFFGEGSLAGQPLRMATATSMTECSILRAQKATMIRMLHREPALAEMFKLAEVKKSDLVYDLGSGDGRIVIAAAKTYGVKAVGYEIDETSSHNLAATRMRQTWEISCDLRMQTSSLPKSRARMWSPSICIRSS